MYFTNIALRVIKNSTAVCKKKLRKIIFDDTVRQSCRQRILKLMCQFQIPAVLRFEIRIACFVSVFVYDKYKRIESLKCRAINTTTRCDCKTIYGIRLPGDITRRE